MAGTEIEFYRGDSYPKEFTITDSVTSEPIDLSGFTLTLTVNSLASPPDNTTELFNVAGVLVDGVGGRVSFTPTSDNNNLSPQIYHYDIQMENGGIIRTVIKDVYTITQDITKA